MVTAFHDTVQYSAIRLTENGSNIAVFLPRYFYREHPWKKRKNISHKKKRKKGKERKDPQEKKKKKMRPISLFISDPFLVDAHD